MCLTLVVGVAVLWPAVGAGSSASAWPAAYRAADQPLETVTVDAGKTTVTTGTVALKTGTKYQLQVSGTFTLANGLGQTFTADALYCFDDSGFDSPACHSPAPPMRFGGFYIGSGSSSLQNIDAYQAPGGGGTQLSYNDSHTYIVDFYPPADGTLTAGGTLAYSHCKSNPTPCTTTISGTITIQVFGPAPPPPPGGGGWVVGGGLELRPPTAFCRVQRNFLPVGDAAAAATPSDAKCVERRLLSPEEKTQAKAQLRDRLYAAAWVCREAGQLAVSPKKGEFLSAVYWALICELEVSQMGATLDLVHDPPDPLFRVPPGSATVGPLARPAASGCPSGPSAAQCAALKAAASNYNYAASVTASVAGYVATGANRVTAAVKAQSPASAFFQEAFAKINEGALVTDLAAERSSGKRLTDLLRANHLDVTVSASQAKRDLSNHLPSALSNTQRTLLVSQLSSISGTLSSGVLGASVPSSAFASQYKAISLTDLASIVNGLVRNGHFSVATGRALVADLGNAQNGCSKASRRIAAMQRFIADAQAQAASYVSFLKLGAQPLMASSIPASSCK